MKRFLLFATVACIAVAAQAQIVGSKNTRVTVTRELSPINDYDRLYFGYADMEPTDEWFDGYMGICTLKGFKAGYLHGFALTKSFPLFLEVGGDLHYGTYSDTYYRYVKERMSILAMNVPVSVAYKFSFKNTLWVEPYAGVSLKLNLLAKGKLTDEEDDYTIVDNYFDNDYMDGYPFKRCQFGGQFGVNVGYKAFNFNLGYHLYSPIWNEDGYKVTFNSFTLGIGYNF